MLLGFLSLGLLIWRATRSDWALAGFCVLVFGFLALAIAGVRGEMCSLAPSRRPGCCPSHPLSGRDSIGS
jgi:hypothetical protein